MRRTWISWINKQGLSYSISSVLQFLFLLTSFYFLAQKNSPYSTGVLDANSSKVKHIKTLSSERISWLKCKESWEGILWLSLSQVSTLWPTNCGYCDRRAAAVGSTGVLFPLLDQSTVARGMGLCKTLKSSQEPCHWGGGQDIFQDEEKS